MDDQRSERRIRNRVIAYYRTVSDSEIQRVKNEIYHTVEPDDSFTFFTSLKKLDSSFGDLNKAFVVMMKQMDAKLNYIIDLLRNSGRDEELSGFFKAYTCDISQSGLSIEVEDELDLGSFVYLKVFLPIALHHTIKILGKVVRVEKVNGFFCVGVDVEDITAENKELIIHYMIYVERKMAKDRMNRDV